jgi:hypothetical protein
VGTAAIPTPHPPSMETSVDQNVEPCPIVHLVYIQSALHGSPLALFRLTRLA